MEMFEVRRKALNEFLHELLHSPSLNGRTHVRVLFLNLNNNYIPGTCEDNPDFFRQHDALIFYKRWMNESVMIL